MEKSCPGQEGHPPNRVNFTERLYQPNVFNRCLFSIPSKVEMAEEQEYLNNFVAYKFQ